AVIDLLAEIARRPTFPEAELEEFKRQALTSLAQQRDDPGSVASRALSRHLNTRPPEHPSYVPSFDEQRERIEALTVEDLRDFHQRFYGFGPGTTIAFVGDFDPDELRQRLETHFGNWNTEVPFERWDNEHEEQPADRMILQLDDKANAILVGSTGFAMSDSHPDYPALQLAGHMMGGGFLSSRLGDRIRNVEGLSYSVGGSFSAHPIDENGSFFVFAAFAPENRERLETVLREELVKATEQGFTAEELESARTGFLREQVLARSDDGRLASLLSSGLYLDRDLFYQAEYEARLAEITVEEVNAAIAEWLDPDAISYAIAGDFNMDQTQSDDAEADQ
ncbi:MAG: pitrilysin family protein, partial [Wenzhouxiangella sp.]|nr:pitrilysin family protein [Wenzhouxiangella sp.]